MKPDMLWLLFTKDILIGKIQIRAAWPYGEVCLRNLWIVGMTIVSFSIDDIKAAVKVCGIGGGIGIFKWGSPSGAASRRPGLSHIPRSWIHCHTLRCTNLTLSHTALQLLCPTLLCSAMPRRHCTRSLLRSISIKLWTGSS